MRAIVIDDEKLIRDALKHMLKTYCPDIELVGEASSVNSGLELIRESTFDILFLDIKMKDGTGFDLLAQIPNDQRNFQLIFTTAYDEFALRAIKQNAIDYLLKPVDPEELQEAVQRVRSIRRPNSESYENLIKMVTQQSGPARISLATAERIFYVDIQKIIRCESSNNYTYFYLKDQSPLLITKTLKEYETILESYGFIRTHQSHLINASEVISFEKQRGNYLLMSDQSEVPVSQRKKDEVLEILRARMS